jgi:myo-inositol-1(or 4)-monophosphatase
MRVSRVTQLEFALLGTGFPFRSQEYLDAWMGTLRRFICDTSGVRRAGSAALDLAHVACGRFDGFWEFGLKPWDMAAGCLLIQEAGGLVSDMRGGSNYFESGNVVTGNPKIHAEMLSRIAPHLTAEITA